MNDKSLFQQRKVPASPPQFVDPAPKTIICARPQSQDYLEKMARARGKKQS